MRHSRCLARRRLLEPPCVLIGIAAGLALATPALADGLLGIFFDRNAIECSGSIATSGYKTLYVVLVTGGSTSSGATGAEFRVDHSLAASYLFTNEVAPPNTIKLDAPLGDGGNVAFSTCQNGGSVVFLSFQVVNPGSAGEAPLFIGAKRSRTHFTCPVAVLCDAPVYTAVCVEGGKAVLNPPGPRHCGSSREDSEWSRVKALYR